jgi:hypothetical protein
VHIEVSRFTHVLMDQVQLMALAFMAIVYVVKLIWLFRFPAARERTPARGSHAAGIRYAYMTLAMPWEMESTSKGWGWLRWTEFAIFHLGVAVAITTTFIMPYAPQVIGGPITVVVLRVVLAAAFVAGSIRLVRRIARPHMRVISSPDDYFSIIILETWLVTAFLAMPQRSEPALVAFFGMTTFFLVYVPFSKISHYLYWPFIRYYQGKHFGHRGTYPKKAVADGAQG